MKHKQYVEPLTDLKTPTNDELKEMYNDLAEKMNIILDYMYYDDRVIKKWGD